MTAAWFLVWPACNAEYGFPDDIDPFGAPNPADVLPNEHTDRVLQVVEPVVDVLWIVDHSPSMDDDRDALAEAFPRFIEPFQNSGVDWHVGVITTDMNTEGHQGRLQERRGVRWLEPDTPNLVETFVEMTRVTLQGSLDEEGRLAAWTALEIENDGFNEGFLRDNEAGYLHMTVVSDEDDDSDDQRVSIESFAEFIDIRKPYVQRTTFNSIVALTDYGPEEIGQAYIDLTEAVGGEVRDINAENWSSLLDDLGGLQAPPAADEFFLSRRPVPETLDVRVSEPTGVTLTFTQGADYTWNEPRNSITFTAGPPEIGSAVEITYTVAAD